MSNKEIIKRLREELEELRKKIMNLKIFLLTKKYQQIKLDQEEQAILLARQMRVMEEYENILIQRISLIQNLIDLENGDK